MKYLLILLAIVWVGCNVNKKQPQIVVTKEYRNYLLSQPADEGYPRLKKDSVTNQIWVEIADGKGNWIRKRKL